MPLKKIVSFFRSCYEHDNRQTTFWNIFHTSIEHRFFMEGEEELLTGDLPYAPIYPEPGLAAKKAAHVYRKEKDLVYCSLFIVGTIIRQEQSQIICAPILIHPAHILEKDSYVFLQANLNERQLNQRLLKAIQKVDSEEPVARQLSEIVENNYVTYPQIADIAALLTEVVPDLDCDDLHQFPSLLSERELKKIFNSLKRKEKARLKVLPASAMALIKKSVETRGVLNELKEVAKCNNFSAPLRFLFADQAVISVPGHSVKVQRVPAVLSSAQQKILRLATTFPVTLVIGPPGTGKSYTIAALAMEHLSRGQSVLIASKMNHAVDVVGNIIEQQLNIRNCVVRGGRKQYLKDLKNYLQQLLSGMHTRDVVDNRQFRLLNRELNNLDRSIAALESRIVKRSRQEIKWGHVLTRPEFSFWDKIKKTYIQWQSGNLPGLWHRFNLLEKQLQQRIGETVQLVQLLNKKRIDQALRKHRSEFRTFLKAIRARTGGKQEDLFKKIDFKILFKAFPIWLVNLADIYDVLPLRMELFDLAIIDEATQCDIASCIPIIQRAKRVVIIGDPNQLRHISFLSKDRQSALLEKYQLSQDKADLFNYRQNSILDFANDMITMQEHVTFLDEHFRSVPPIIEFSNKNFYSGSLRIMTQKPETTADSPLKIKYCNGKRSESGENVEEARTLIEDVISLIESERNLSPDLCHSIGILSPLRAQVDYLSEELPRLLPIDVFEKHDILIGTAHTFQGEERDTMFLSFAVDPDTHPGALRFLEKRDIFNVSITRARVKQHIYSSLGSGQVNVQSLLGAYHSYIERVGCEEFGMKAERNYQKDEFLDEVSRTLTARGFKTWLAYPVAGLIMDLVVSIDNKSYGIDLIGYPGEFEAAFSLERYRIFYRAGLRIFPLPYSKWLLNKDECLKAIEKFMI